MMYRVPPAIEGGGLKGLDLAASNIPSEADAVAAYCDRTGRDAIPNLQFHLAYNLFRFAAIIHGIKGRALRGNASSTRADKVSRSEEHTSELQSLMRIQYAVFCLKQKHTPITLQT